MTEPRPIDVTRKDGVLVPKQKWLFDRLFPDEGADYTIEPYEERSTKSHRHLFACVREAWKNLPENLSKQHPDAEHLRKFALIKTGWSIKRNVVCETTEQAYNVAALAGALDESAVVVVQGMVVTIATARSQKRTGPGCMNKEEFQKSKDDVLGYCANLIGVDVDTLSAQVPHSSDALVSGDRTDTPAGASGPQSSGPPAGVSNWPSDWFDQYVSHVGAPINRANPVSLLTLHTEAIQTLGDQSTANQQAVIKQTWRAIRDRNEGAITLAEYDLRIARLKAIATGTRHSAGGQAA